MKTYQLFVLIGLLAAGCGSAPKQPSRLEPEKPFDLQGHRGARGLAPENSVIGCLKVLNYRDVTTIEMDLAVSADSLLVLSHEPYFAAEFCLKPNGDSITVAEEQKLALYKMPYAEIKTYDCGSKPHPRFPDQAKLKVAKPLFSELVDTVFASLPKFPGRQINFNIEIKSKREWDGVLTPEPDVFARLLYAELLKIKARWKLGNLDAFTIQSFDPRALRQMRKLDKTLSLALLVENDQSVEKNLAKFKFKPAIYSPKYELVTAEMVNYLHDQKIKVIPWTANDPKEMKRLLELGVDGLITDYPDRFPADALAKPAAK